MGNELIEITPVEKYSLQSGRTKYRIEVIHRGLQRHREFKGDFPGLIERKAQIQAAEWSEKWVKRRGKEREQKRKAQNQELAEERTGEAQDAIHALRNTLGHTLDIDDTIDWDSLKSHETFAEPKPDEPACPDAPREPQQSDAKYKPNLHLLHHLVPPWRRQKIEAAEELFLGDHQAWEKAQQEHNEAVATLKSKHHAAVKEWKERKESYEHEQHESNEEVEREKKKYLEADPEAITEYCDLVLTRSEYPDEFPQDFDLFFNPDASTLVVDYLLPAPENLPTLKEVKYVKSRDEMVEKHLSERELNKLYDELLYQISLRTIHELYEADQIGALQAVVFNGIVHTIDKATGQEIKPCVLSVQAERDEFLSLNLEHVEPKTCFKSLKGVGSSKLHSITPVAPIMKVDKEDARFVESREVTGNLDEATNLAAMDWEDFEHLIREVFAKEFAQSGGEVKITQASRDGGVDAIAFDPDPIRGGKIVIQAKRYTNTVGVAAVRDLYGTVMNEGAIKGILVTTSDYGPDAYGFAKDKPITLLNGGNLLHMLQRHGHKAKIDLKEARRIASEQG
jgi:restriction system protein